eukprot:826365-Rhodomonas_salina.1
MHHWQSSQFQQYTQINVPLLQQLIIPSEGLGEVVAPRKQGSAKPENVRQPSTRQECLPVLQFPACCGGCGERLCTTRRGDSWKLFYGTVADDDGYCQRSCDPLLSKTQQLSMMIASVNDGIVCGREIKNAQDQ